MVSSLKSGKTLWASLLALVLLAAMACSNNEPAAVVAPTPVPASEIAAMIRDAVTASMPAATDPAAISKMIESAIAAKPGVTAEELQAAIASQSGQQLTTADVKAVVDAALKSLPAPKIDAGQIKSLVQDAVAASVPEGTSAADISAMVSAAVAAATADAPTRGDMAAAITAAIAAQTSGQLTADQVQAIVAASIQGAVDAAEQAAAAAETASATAKKALALAAALPKNDRPAAAELVTFSLGEINGSGQTGKATLTASGGRTIVKLQLSAGATQTELVHIHAGQCGDSLGAVAYPLTSFVDGSGASVTTVDAALDSLRSGAFAINAHKSGDPGVNTACGNIPASGKSVAFALDGFSSSGQSGTALLTASGNNTIVTLTLSKGALETKAVHIHAGQCGDSLGSLAYPLASFVDGSGTSVTTVGASLDSLLTGGFAINAHEAGDPSIYTACGNIPMSAASVTFALEEMNDSGQIGAATLTPDGDSTIVTLSLSTGTLETELVHIHAGECGALGDIVYPLTSFVNGSGISATTLDASLDSLLTGGFAINAHESGDPDVDTACGNIPSGG